MKRTILIAAMVALAGVAHASDIKIRSNSNSNSISNSWQSQVMGAAFRMETPAVLAWWERANKVCEANLTGEVTVACQDRTDLAAVLERRGMCKSALPYGTWQACIVGSDGTQAFGPEADERLYLRDRNRFYMNPNVEIRRQTY